MNNKPVWQDIQQIRQILIIGKTIGETWGEETNPDEGIPKYVDWYQSDKIKLSELITDVYKLEDINRAFDDLENGEVGRALITTK